MSPSVERSPLAVALAGVHPEMDPRALLSWAAGLGCAGVQIDAGRAGLRGRDLDRSARRDLAALLRRHELSFAGLDLWIPPEHFVDTARVDHAASAVVAALALAADLAGLSDGGAVVCCVLPDVASDAIVTTLADEAARCGVTILDHAWPASPRPVRAGLVAGVDPVRVIAAGDDPAAAMIAAVDVQPQVRLGDSDGARPAVLGEGRLDLAAYAAAAMVIAPEAMSVLDLRGLPVPADAARRGFEAWASTTTVGRG